MANVFKRVLSRNVGTTSSRLGGFTAPVGATDTIIGLSLANTINQPVTVDVYIFDGSNNTYMIKGAPIPVGAALIVVGGDQKIVLQPGDSVWAVSSAATSVDVVMSMLEAT